LFGLQALAVIGRAVCGFFSSSVVVAGNKRG